MLYVANEKRLPKQSFFSGTHSPKEMDTMESGSEELDSMVATSDPKT